MASKSINLTTINKAMLEAGLSQSALASKMEVSRETVSQWLKGNKQPRPAKLLELSKVLDLSFQAILDIEQSSQPQVAFRTNRKKAVSEDQKALAEDMGHSLKYLVPYLDGHSVFEPPILQKPELSYSYIEKVAEELRLKYKINTDIISFESIMAIYQDFKIVVIPVLWGENGDNGLCVKLPDEGITFIYANLEKVVTDFKFWLIHEVVHAMTPTLNGDISEDFADSLAGALLMPQKIVEEYYNQISKINNVGTIVNLIKQAASRLVVSPFTVYRQLNRFAEYSGKRAFDFNIGAVTTVFNKQIQLVSEAVFDEKHPEAGKYVTLCNNVFRTPFFQALSKYLVEREKGSGFVQRVLNISIADAKGIYQTLAHR